MQKFVQNPQNVWSCPFTSAIKESWSVHMAQILNKGNPEVKLNVLFLKTMSLLKRKFHYWTWHILKLVSDVASTNHPEIQRGAGLWLLHKSSFKKAINKKNCCLKF